MLPEYDFQVLKLTQEFYNKYTNPPYVEIETKENRRYNCLLIQTHYDYFICVPFRSRVKHKYAYLRIALRCILQVASQKDIIQQNF